MLESRNLMPFFHSCPLRLRKYNPAKFCLATIAKLLGTRDDVKYQHSNFLLNLIALVDVSAI